MKEIIMTGGAPALPREQESKEPTPAPNSLEEQIRQRAYAIYLQRGGKKGLEQDDWLRAEEQLRQAEELDYNRGTDHWPSLERG